MKELKKMTKEEILKEIDKLEDKKFFLDMKDVWENKDYDLMDEYDKQIYILIEELEKRKEK